MDVRPYGNFMELPDRAGVMILGGCHLFPQAMVPLFIFEPRYRAMLDDALTGDRMFCLAMQQSDSTKERPCDVASLGLIRASVKNDNGTSNLVLQGITRVRLGKQVQTKPYRVHLLEPIAPEPRKGPATDALIQRTLDLVDARLRLGAEVPVGALAHLAGAKAAKEPAKLEDCLRALRHLDDPGLLADLVTALLLNDAAMRQIILQTVDTQERLQHVVHFLMGEVSRLQKNSAP
jgi:Lon protease-like protein